MTEPKKKRDGNPLVIGHGIIINSYRSSVFRNGIEVSLSPQQFRIFERISKATYGISAENLFTWLYDNDSDGGPSRGHKVLHVQRVNINKKLKAIGVSIMSHKKGIGGVYQITVMP